MWSEGAGKEASQSMAGLYRKKEHPVGFRARYKGLKILCDEFQINKTTYLNCRGHVNETE